MVQVIAHDGVEQRVRMRVVNYAYPTRFVSDDTWSQEFWDELGPQISAFVTAVLSERTGSADLSFDDSGQLVTSGSLSARIRSLAMPILTGYWAEVTIEIGPLGLSFEVSDPDAGQSFDLDYGFSDYRLSEYPPAPHWAVSYYEESY